MGRDDRNPEILDLRGTVNSGTWVHGSGVHGNMSDKGDRHNKGTRIQGTW